MPDYAPGAAYAHPTYDLCRGEPVVFHQIAPDARSRATQSRLGIYEVEAGVDWRSQSFNEDM